MSYEIAQALPFFADLDGKPLQNGSLYFGAPDLNPVTAPTNVFWDRELTQPAAQPVKTINGSPSRNGTPAKLYAAIDYSLLVLDHRGRQVMSVRRVVVNEVVAATEFNVENLVSTQGQILLNLMTPIPLNKNAVAVNIDGRVLQRTDFEVLSPLSIQLDAPLQGGLSIEVASGAIFGASMNASQIGWIANGAGSVARTVDDKLQEIPSVLDKGADRTGATDSTLAFNNSVAIPVLVPPGTYRTEGALTGAKNVIAFGAFFTGASKLDAWTPGFGIPVMHIMTTDTLRNAIVGSARNTAPAGSFGFPTGVTGLGRNDNDGNTAFGIYAEGRQYANTGCVVGAELDSFNFGAPPTNTTLPNRGIGTTQQLPNAVTIGAGGTADSWCATHFVREGSSPRSFIYGALFDANAITESAIVIEASPGVGPNLPVLLKHKIAAIGQQWQGVGTPVAANSWGQYVDGSGMIQQAFKQNGEIWIRTNKILAPRVTGWSNPIGPRSRATFDSATATTSEIGQRLAALLDDLGMSGINHGIIGA